MSEMKHTPGPWIVIEYRILRAQTGVMLADIWSPKAYLFSDGVRTANAHLMAAAPDLLEALKNLVRINEEWNAAVEATIARPPDWTSDYLLAAKAAIAKAEGV